jgi:hypothetical protein
MSDPLERWQCPEALRHGPLDGAGRCPWCRRQVDSAVSYVAGETFGRRTELAEAYAITYDPDEGALGRVEMERLLRAGQVWV